MGIMHTLDKTGDVRTSWDPNKGEEVDQARRQFEALTKKGYAAFRVAGLDWKKGEQVRTFDPKAERIILIPQVAGG